MKKRIAILELVVEDEYFDSFMEETTNTDEAWAAIIREQFVCCEMPPLAIADGPVRYNIVGWSYNGVTND